MGVGIGWVAGGPGVATLGSLGVGLVWGVGGLDLADSGFVDAGVEVEQGFALDEVTFGKMVAGIDVGAEEQAGLQLVGAIVEPLGAPFLQHLMHHSEAVQAFSGGLGNGVFQVLTGLHGFGL